MNRWCVRFETLPYDLAMRDSYDYIYSYELFVLQKET